MQQLFGFIEHFNWGIMKEEKKRGRGKPKRYEGEESERLSVLVRPRYKKMVEKIAQVRQTTISEAMEYAIADAARNFTVEGKSIYSWVLFDSEVQENIDKYCNLILDNSSQYHDNSKKFRDLIEGFQSEPSSLKKPYSLYIEEVFCHYLQIKNEYNLKFSHVSNMLNIDSLVNVLIEEWKSANPSQRVAEFLILLGVLFDSGFLVYKDQVTNLRSLHVILYLALEKFNQQDATKEFYEQIILDDILLKAKKDIAFQNE